MVGFLFRRTRRPPAPPADSASSAVAKLSTKMRRICTSKRPTRSRCRSKVRLVPIFVLGNYSHLYYNVVREAGKSFEKAAAIQTKNLNEPDDAANTMVDAFKAYRVIDAEAASRCLDVAVQRYCVKGNFRRAATHKESLGDLYETELGDNKKAMECYEAAAGWYEGDNALAYVRSLAPSIHI